MEERVGDVLLLKLVGRVARIVAIGLSLFQLYTAAFGIFRSPVAHRAVHVGLILLLFFLGETLDRKGSYGLFNLLLAILSVGVAGYLTVSDQRIQALIGLGEPTLIDEIAGVLITLLLLEALRRTQKEIFILSLAGIAYMWLGSKIPGTFGHAGMSWSRIIYILGLSSEGIFGDMVNVTSTFLYLFLLLGAFLTCTRVSDLFIALGLRVVGRLSGGPAKVSILGSGLVGMVMGSGIANVATTGVLTIPLMIRTGISRAFAAAVESVAADGGQILPPVMGTSAFLMAEFTGIPYAQIAVAAFIPAVIYYIAAYSGVHFYAVRNRALGLSREEIPSWKEILNRIHLLLPLVLLFYFIFVVRATPMRAGLIAIGSALLASLLRRATRPGFSDILLALERGAKSAVEIVILCAGMGIFVGSVVTTGLAMRLTEIIMSVSGGNLLVGLVLAMIASIVLGTALPTPATYMVSAAFVAPALVKLGVPLLAAHLFLVHFAIKSSISPPVAVTCVVAAGIAGANWWAVAWESIKLSLVSFLVPFMFVYNPALLVMDSWPRVLLGLAMAVVGAVAIAGGIQGFLSRPLSGAVRVLCFMGGLLLMYPSALTYSAGAALVLVVALMQGRRGFSRST